MKLKFNPQHFSSDWKWCFGIWGQCLSSIRLVFPICVCLWSPSRLGMWKIYSDYTKEQNPAGSDHPSVITEMIGLQTMAHTCVLGGGHSGELSLHPHGSLLVKSWIFYDFPKAISHKGWGHRNKNVHQLGLGTIWTWKQMWATMGHSMVVFFGHLGKSRCHERQ